MAHQCWEGPHMIEGKVSVHGCSQALAKRSESTQCNLTRFTWKILEIPQVVRAWKGRYNVLGVSQIAQSCSTTTFQNSYTLYCSRYQWPHAIDPHGFRNGSRTRDTLPSTRAWRPMKCKAWVGGSWCRLLPRPTRRPGRVPLRSRGRCRRFCLCAEMSPYRKAKWSYKITKYIEICENYNGWYLKMNVKYKQKK